MEFLFGPGHINPPLNPIPPPPILPQELLLPPASTGFTVLRVPLRDVDEEDIAAHFDSVTAFIQVGEQAGGGRRGGGGAVHDIS